MRRSNRWLPSLFKSMPLQVSQLEDRCTPANFSVNSALDSVSPDASLTLREAINAVNSQSTASLSAQEKALVTGNLGDSDTITFASSVNGSTIALSGSRLNLQRSLTIAGPGADKLTIDGGKDIGLTKGTQIFFVDGRTNPGTTVTISGLQLANAFARDGTGTTTNSIDNSVRGGAIFNDAASLSLNDIYIRDSVAQFGGAISGFGGFTNATRSTFSSNRGTINGGGITNGAGHTTNLDQCTVDFNASEGFTAAITNVGTSMAIISCTITSNFTINPGSSAEASAGIYLGVGAATIIRNSVLDGNTKNGATGADFNSTDGGTPVAVIGNSNNNFVGSLASGGMVNTVNGNIVSSSIDPNLSLLQANGGPMPTKVPRAGSPLINAGSNSSQFATTDARGFDRFAFNDGSTGAGAVIDIGATEFVSQAFTIEVNENSNFIAIAPDVNLINAIRISNENPGTQTITFNAKVFAAPQTITLNANSNAELVLSDSVTINGPAARVTIDAGGKSRIFRTDLGAVTIRNLTLTGGSSTDGGALNIGDEIVSLIDCTLTGNTSSGDGGAINIQYGGTLNLTRTTISGNTAASAGGGVSFNVEGRATIVDSAILNNKATSDGGGFYFFGSVTGLGLNFRNTTISGNSSGGNGGGIVLRNVVGTTLVQNSTITNNTAATNGGGISRLGSGSGIVDLQSTILSGNVNATAADLASVTNVSATSSAIGSAPGVTFGTNIGNIFGQNLLLGPLTNNGGPTLTHQPALASPVKNKGSNPATLTNDARGPGFPRSAAGGVDIGAIEAVPPAPTNFVVTNSNDAGAGSLRQAILDANANSGVADTITFSGFFDSPRLLNLATGPMTISDSLTLTGPGAERLTIDAQNNSRIFFVNNAANVTIRNVQLTRGSANVHGGAINVSNGAALTVTDSILTGNTAKNSGGAISTFGALTLDRTTLTGNRAGVDGGAFFSRGLLLTNSTLNGNSAAMRGGAILLNGPTTGTFVIQNTTISGNTAASASAINLGYLAGTYAMNSPLAIQNSTITANSSSTGGVVQLAFGTGALEIENSIVSGNTVSTGDIVSPNTVNVNRSAIGAPSGFTLTGANNLPFFANLRLGSLAKNGGPVATIALGAGSPAINAGSGATADARGFAPFGVRDIGAFEVQPVVISPATLPNGQLGSAYNQTILAGFPTLPAGTTATFAVTAGALPVGLTLAANGTLNGTPTAVSSSNFTITATANTGDASTRDYTLAVTNPNVPPTISQLVNQTSGIGTSSQPFTIADDLTPVDNLVLSAASSNPAVVPLAGIMFAGTGGNRSIIVTSGSQVGSSTITITVTDGNGGTAQSSFLYTVIANAVPTITSLFNRTSFGAAVSQVFTLSDDLTPVAGLALAAATSNPALVPLANIVFGGSGASRTVSAAPAAGKVGNATITITVTDGNGATAQSAFVFTARNLLENEFSVGADKTTQASVTLRNADNTLRFTLAPFGNFTGGIRTAAGDFNGDGIADLVAASGPGRPGEVRVFDGVTQAEIPLPQANLPNNQPFGSTFTRGIIVNVGDMNNDGLSDLIITAEAGGGARVRILQSTGSSFIQRSDFIALIGGDNVPDSKIFRGGSRAAVSDINGDGVGDLIWAAGAGGGPRIATFNGTQLNGGDNVFFKLTGDFFALSTNLRDGAYVQGGDVNGDGIGDLIAGGGSGAPPQVVGYSGSALLANSVNPQRFLDFNFGTNSGQGIRVAVKDLNADNVADVIVGSAPGAGSRVAAFDGRNLNGSNTGNAIFDFNAFPGFSGGVFVG